MDNFKNDRSVRVETLFSIFFKVADFQREYVWEEDDISGLINDLLESYEENASKYFLGAIVLTEDENDKFLIIDGQQRITTLTIILAAMREKIKLTNKQVYNYLSKCLADDKLLKDGSIEKLPRLRFDEVKADELLGLLINDPDKIADIEDSTDTVNNIKNNYCYALSHLEKLAIPLNKFTSYILTNTVLLPYITTDQKQALIVFETLNSKGKSLTPIDLLKNALFANEKEDNWDSLKNQWREFKSTLDSLNESDKRFLKYYILVTYNTKVGENDVFEWIVNDQNTTIKQSPFKFLENIKNFAEAYRFILQNKGPDGTDNKNIVNIRSLAEKGRQFFPLLISLRRVNSNSQNYEMILLAIESVIMSYSILRAYTGAIESTFSEWTKKLNDASSDDEIQKLINLHIDPEVQRLGKLAYDKLLKATSSDMAKKRIIYILLRIESYLNQQSGGAFKSYVDFSNYELEHIIAKKYEPKIYTSLSEDQHKEIVHMLGNLTLLEKPLNRAVKNKDVATKISYYENSSFLLCKASVSNVDGNSTLAKAYNKVFKISKDMDRYETLERQRNLANLVAAIYQWKI